MGEVTAISTTARRILLGVAFTAAGIAGAAAYDAATHAAHADTKPGIVAEQGGLLGHDLPQQASDRAKDVVDQVLPGPECDEPAAEPAPESTSESTSEPEPEPTSEPDPELTVEPTPTEEPEPADEPVTEPRGTEPTPAPTADPVVDVPPVEVPPVVVETPPVVVDPTPTTEPTPTPDPIAIDVPVTLPSTDPAPLPDASEPIVQPKPRPVIPPAPALPVQLPVLIGPVPATTTEHPATIGELPGAAIEATPPAADCAGDPRDAVHVDRDLIRQLIDSLTTTGTKPAVKAAPGCPDKPKPAPEQPACTGTTTAGGNASSNGSGHLFADTTTALTLPTLDRLEHLRARSTIPASRHVAVEPGPA